MHATAAELDAGLAHIRQAPADAGTVELIARRPHPGQREVLEEAELDVTVGLVGDGWSALPSSSTPDGSPHPDKQVTLMNARVIALLARDRERWSLAGDQLYVDLDLSEQNLPAGTRLAVGSAVIEITPPPHTGCAKFVERFGREATRFLNSREGRSLRLRGVNAKVVQPGTVRHGDTISKMP